MRREELVGKHVHVTGGGGGLGFAFIKKVVALGANVSFSTKDSVKGTELIRNQLVPLYSKPDSQIVVAVQGGLHDAQLSRQAVNEATALMNGHAPDIVLLTAGFAEPGLFLDMEPEVFTRGMEKSYFTHAWTVQATARLMREQHKGGTIIMVSNFLSENSYAGYSAYAPTKYAIKGLCDSIRPELEPLGIHVQLLLLSGQFGDNYDAEMATKPEITKGWDAKMGYMKLDEATEAEKILSALVDY